MSILVQRTTIWAIAAFFGCVSLLGPGWHCVFGHHFHGSELCAHGPADTSTDRCLASCCAPERIAAETAPAADSTRTLSVPAISALATPGHHCPLCQFFGTAQWSPSFAPTELVLVATELPTPVALSCDREAPRLYLSRAPPRDHTHC